MAVCLQQQTSQFLLYLPLVCVYAQHQLRAHFSEQMFSMERALGKGSTGALTQQGFDDVGLTLYTLSGNEQAASYRLAARIRSARSACSFSSLLVDARRNACCAALPVCCTVVLPAGTTL